MDLSVALAVFNEEQNIARCLESIKSTAKEIVIVDGGSRDNTVKIAKSYGAKIHVTDNPPIFHINKQKALDFCENNWILQLDADECVTPMLAKEISTILSMDANDIKSRKINPGKQKLFNRHLELLNRRDNNQYRTNTEIVAFFVPRLNYFLGGPIRYSGTYPDGVIRLVKKGKATFPCRSVHEQIQVNGSVAWLENDLLHYSNPTISKYWKNASAYIDLKVNELNDNHIGKNIINFMVYMLIKPWKYFCFLYFRHKGIMDGWRGLIFAIFSSWHYPKAYLKYLKNK